MESLTKRSLSLIILLYSINQSGAVAFGSASSLIAMNKISDRNLVSSSSVRRLSDGVSRKLMYPTNRNYVYLNYKETYGIRYDPSGNGHENRFSLPQVEAPSESDTEGGIGTMQPSEKPMLPETSETPGSNESMPTEATTFETTTECITEAISTVAVNMGTNDSSTSQTTNKRATTIAFSSLTHKNTNKLKNNATQIVRPISSIRETLNLIRKRVKQWFTSGIDLNAPLVNGQRFLNVFNIIKFENSECTSTQEMLDEMTGTCYHDYQCTEMGGTSIGECADGLGVCCICMLRRF